jgi:hypothetical protein
MESGITERRMHSIPGSWAAACLCPLPGSPATGHWSCQLLVLVLVMLRQLPQHLVLLTRRCGRRLVICTSRKLRNPAPASAHLHAQSSATQAAMRSVTKRRQWLRPPTARGECLLARISSQSHMKAHGRPRPDRPGGGFDRWNLGLAPPSATTRTGLLARVGP